MSIYGWKSFDEEEDRPEKPRSYGVTEMRGPHYSFFTQNALQDIFEYKGEFVDGLKFCGGSHSMMTKGFIKQITEMAHKHNVYVSTGDWAEHLLRQGPSAFKTYVQDCKELGFDTIELNVDSLQVPEEALLRFVRLIKGSGLKAKPQFTVKFNKADLPVAGDRAFGAYVFPVPRTSVPLYHMTGQGSTVIGVLWFGNSIYSSTSKQCGSYLLIIDALYFSSHCLLVQHLFLSLGVF
ncbi:hypothetical protein MKW94_000562 [Papaver nudicaule]|uniref:Uncharacterized protein n=1 Tax=Papaver nudicaule TaxID=74823 RepID=A0AA41V578_PAPNU|nr:hypothetical protein [Papaver nudicaule]